MHLPTDADAEEDLLAAPTLTSTFTDEIPGDVQAAGSKAVEDTKPMRGWAYLLLWLPAACDLTGTTVSGGCVFVLFSFCATLARSGSEALDIPSDLSPWPWVVPPVGRGWSRPRARRVVDWLWLMYFPYPAC